MIKYTCDICVKEFNNLRSLHSHETFHRNEIKYPNGIKCPHCNRVCLTVKSLLTHNSLMHKAEKQQIIVYELLTNDHTKHLCEICNKEALFIDAKTGYSRTCSDSCKRQLKSVTTKKNHKKRDYTAVLNKCKITWIKNLGVDNPRKSKKIKEKIIATNNIRYGEDYGVKSCLVKTKIKKSNIDRFGVDNFCKSEEYKNLYKDPEWVRAKMEKECMAKKNNKTFNTSKPEKELFEKIQLLYPSTQFQKTDYPNFPFNVDYYIPEFDLLIEYQGSWTHGKEPFDINNSKHIEILAKWKDKAINSKYYQNAIETWTIRDTNKLKIANELHLNYLRLYMFNTDECVNQIQKEIQTIKSAVTN